MFSLRALSTGIILSIFFAGTWVLRGAWAEGPASSDPYICEKLRELDEIATANFSTYVATLEAWEQVPLQSGAAGHPGETLTSTLGVLLTQSETAALKTASAAEAREAAFRTSIEFEQKLTQTIARLFFSDASGLNVKFDFVRNDPYIQFRLRWMQNRLGSTFAREKLIGSFREELEGASQTTRKAFEERLGTALDEVLKTQEYWSRQAIGEIRQALGSMPATDSNILSKISELTIQRLRASMELQTVEAIAQAGTKSMVIEEVASTTALRGIRPSAFLGVAMNVVFMVLTPVNSVNYEGDINAFFAKDLNRFFTDAFRENLPPKAAENRCLLALQIIHTSDRSYEGWLFASDRKIHPVISISDFESKLIGISEDLKRHLYH